MTTAILFENERAELEEEWDGRVPTLRKSNLFWLDLDERSEDAAARAREALDLTEASERSLASTEQSPRFTDHGHYVHVTVTAPVISSDDAECVAHVDCLVAERWVVTAHDRPVDVLDDLAERTQGSGAIGALEGSEFLAILMEWVMGAYERAFERVEQELEHHDLEVMSSKPPDTRHCIDAIVRLRQEIRELRRALVDHREILVALAHPELEALGSERSAARFRDLLGRYEATREAGRDAREGAVASFDVVMALTAQRTNQVMKILALVSVMILPGTLLAGVMGMNFKVGLFAHASLFWIVLLAILASAATTLYVASRRGWL